MTRRSSHLTSHLPPVAWLSGVFVSSCDWWPRGEVSIKTAKRYAQLARQLESVVIRWAKRRAKGENREKLSWDGHTHKETKTETALLRWTRVLIYITTMRSWNSMTVGTQRKKREKRDQIQCWHIATPPRQAREAYIISYIHLLSLLSICAGNNKRLHWCD